MILGCMLVDIPNEVTTSSTKLAVSGTSSRSTEEYHIHRGEDRPGWVGHRDWRETGLELERHLFSNLSN